MKKIVAAAAALFVAFGATASAETVDLKKFWERLTHEVEVTSALGVAFPSESQDNREDGLMGSMRFTVPFAEQYSDSTHRVGLDLLGSSNEGVGTDDVNYRAAMLVSEWSFPEVPYVSDYGLVPNAFVGVGVVSLDGNGTEGGEHFAVQYGLGVRREVYPGVDLGLQSRVVRSAGDVISDFGRRTNLTTNSLLATLTYSF